MTNNNALQPTSQTIPSSPSAAGAPQGLFRPLAPSGAIPDPPLSSAGSPKAGERNPFEDAEIICAYTRRQAIADGFQIDANEGDFAEVTHQHFKLPVYFTAGVFELIEAAVANPRWSNDRHGVWHDICWMAVLAMRAHPEGDRVTFRVIIRGASRKSSHAMVAAVGPRGLDVDDAEPAITIMLPEED